MGLLLINVANAYMCGYACAYDGNRRYAGTDTSTQLVTVLNRMALTHGQYVRIAYAYGYNAGRDQRRNES